MMNRNSKHDAASFANGRTMRAIVASFSLLAILVIGGRWIEEYLMLSRDAAEVDVMKAEFEETHRRRQRLLAVEAKLNQALSAARKRGIVPQNMEQVRETLIKIVRDAGASLRRLEVGENEVRMWSMENDDPRNDTMPLYSQASPFRLHKHRVEIQADGTIGSVQEILKAINTCGWSMSTKNMLISPTGSAGSLTSIEFNLILYGLEFAPEDSLDDQDFAMRPDPHLLR
jgi:hypothetical protein